MKLSTKVLRGQADQFVKDGHVLAAVGVYVAVLRRAPEDFEARALGRPHAADATRAVKRADEPPEQVEDVHAEVADGAAAGRGR